MIVIKPQVECTTSQQNNHQERIIMDDILKAMGGFLLSKGQTTAIPYQHINRFGKVGPVYGDKVLLKQVLISLLAKLADTCKPGFSVRTELRQIGNFLYLQCQVVPVRKKNRALAGYLGKPMQNVLPKSICEYVITAHGGHLSMKYQGLSEIDAQDKDIESITLMLPTGAPFVKNIGDL